MFGHQFINMLVPPWNRIDPQLVPELTATGLKSLSTFGWENFASRPGLVQINTHVDIIDWKGTRGGRPVDELAKELATELEVARKKGGAPVGILTHHLVHDYQAWAFLQQLFQFVRDHQEVTWSQAASLLPG
jgi:hypothetical protein